MFKRPRLIFGECFFYVYIGAGNIGGLFAFGLQDIDCNGLIEKGLVYGLWDDNMLNYSSNSLARLINSELVLGLKALTNSLLVPLNSPTKLSSK